MSIFYVKKEQIAEKTAYIQGTDVNHIKNVLRDGINDEILICDEEGKRYLTRICSLEKERIMLEIIEEQGETTEPSVQVTLWQGMPKADKLEWIIQKGTELGVSEVIPFLSERVVVKLDEKSLPKKLERWNRIALEAAKQSGRQKVPVVKNPINLSKLVENISDYDIVLLPYECEKKVTLKAILRKQAKECKKVAVVIGPEGGFAETEVALLEQAGAQRVTLGPRILRTETASIASLAMVLYELEE